jgi:3-(3-hydroxy-phenyl)propionate hydroxylase
MRVSVLGYRLPVYEFRRPPELRGERPGAYEVVIVGAGLAGLTLAAELGRRGVPVVLLEQGASLGVAGIASRGIAYAKRTMEIFDRIGIARRLRDKGQTWNEGWIYDGLDEIYHYQLQPEADQQWPAFINLQQFYVEGYLVERIGELGNVDLRWQSKVIGVRMADPREPGDGIGLTVDTPEGPYELQARWVAACDGARSSVRRLLGIQAPLAQLEDTWAIVDVHADLPGLQRRIYLNSPLIEGGAIVMHPMADGVVRADWQIGQLEDPAAEIQPDRVRERLARFLGEQTEFEIVSISKWSYRRRVMDQLVHGRAAFLGDATRSPRSAPEGGMAASRTPRTWPGSSRPWCRVALRRRCSTPTPASADRRRPRTRCFPVARRPSLPRDPVTDACSEMRSSGLPASTNSPARGLTPGGPARRPRTSRRH